MITRRILGATAAALATLPIFSRVAKAAPPAAPLTEPTVTLTVSQLQEILRTAVDGTLESLVARRAIHQYEVVCDARNNPPSDLPAYGKVRLEVMIKDRLSPDFIHIEYDAPVGRPC